MESILKDFVSDFEGLPPVIEEIDGVMKQLELLIKNSEPVLTRPLPPPRSKPIDEKDWATQEFDPNSPYRSHEHYRLHQAYRVGGWPGLQGEAFELCRAHSEAEKAARVRANKPPSDPASDPHRHILDDYSDTGTGQVMPYLLAGVHPDFLDAILTGNVTERHINDRAFREMVDRHHKPDHWPGIYYIEITNREWNGTQQSRYPGRGLTWHEWSETVDILRRYLQAYRNKQRTAETIAIDSVVPKRGQEKDFRYIAQDTAAATVEKFIIMCERNYVASGRSIFGQDPTDPRLDIAFMRMPQEVGWGLYSGDRSSEHVNQKSTNYLLGIFDATIRYKFGVDRFEVRAYLACRIASPDFAQLAESFFSEIVRSYWYAGGLNPELAGTIPVTRLRDPEHDHKFYNAAEILVRSGLMQEAMNIHRANDEKTYRAVKYCEENSYSEIWKDLHQRQKDLSTCLEQLREKVHECYVEALVQELEDIGFDQTLRADEE